MPILRIHRSKAGIHIVRRWRIRGEWRSGTGSEERGEAGDCKARDEGEEAGGRLMR